MQNKSLKIFLAVITGLMLISGSALAQFPYWTDYYGGMTQSTLYNSSVVPVGSVIEAYAWENDMLGDKVGSTMVSESGKYGYLSVTNQSGISADDPVVFYVNDRPATSLGPDSPTFASFYDQKEVNLSAEGVVDAVFTPPADQFSGPGLEATFTVTIENTGNGLDFYQITSVTSNNGWLVSYDNENFTYIHDGETGQVTFSVLIPPATLLDDDQLEFTVASMIDNSVSYTGTANVSLSPTDVEDEYGNQLPGQYRLMQNYPNPFNPSTTIAFELPRAELVTIEVYDLLGKLIERAELGRLTAGRHTYDFAAGNLASGVYLYRLKAGDFSAMKKMALLK